MSHSIGDEELLLCHWADPALDPGRRRAIREALAEDPALRARLRELVAGLEAQAQSLVPPELPRDYEARLWSRLAPRLEPRPVPARRRSWAVVLRDWLGGPGLPRLAFAASLALALGVGVYVGRGQAPAPAVTLSDDAAQRVLAAYLNAHLESTERVLLVAANSPGERQTTQALSRELLSSNRFYAAAARRAGRPQLAAFLRQIEPVLLELARGGEAEAVGARIRDEDLPFKARAAAALARRGATPEPDPELRPL